MTAGMKCPECGAWTIVLESRPLASNTIRRRRECGNEHRFVTQEKFVGFIKPKGKRNQVERVEPVSKSNGQSVATTDKETKKTKRT